MRQGYPEAVVRSPKLSISDSYRDASFPTALFVLLFLPIFVLVVLVVSWDKFFFSLNIILVFTGTFLLFSGGFLATRPAPMKVIRVRSETRLRFLPSRLMPVFYVAVFLLFIASFMPLLEILMTGESTIAQTPGMRSVFWFVTVVGGLAGVAHAIFGIFYPFGVTLDEAGIVCRTFLGRPWFVSWASLEEVELGRKGRVKALKLYSADEGVSTIIPMTMGSDPIVIAETIEYFRRHPGDRELLNDPFAALSLVVDFDPAPQSADGRESRR